LRCDRLWASPILTWDWTARRFAEEKRAIEMDPANSLYLGRLAQVYLWTGRCDGARAAYERAFALESEAQGTLLPQRDSVSLCAPLRGSPPPVGESARPDPRKVFAPAYLALLAALQGRFQDAEATIPSDIHEAEKLRERKSS
jgi:hypothetical protein